MTPSQKIAVNTLATYSRTVFVAAVSIFTSRWVLNVLGASDYGLFAVVGAVIGFITFLNGVLSGSVARHYAFSIGQGQPSETKKWFNTALGIHMVLPVVLISIGCPIGEHCIRHVFVIPPERVETGVLVFRISLIVAYINMLSVPYMAMFAAKQRVVEVALIGVVQSVAAFCFAYSLHFVRFDKLIFYAAYGAGLSIAVQVVQMVLARRCFEECRCNLHLCWDRQRMVEIISFAGWNLLGALGIFLRSQGVAVLLNLNFGTKVNAAYGIANTVSSQTTSLSAAMANAISPAVTTAEGGGDRTRVLDLALQFCKFGALLILLFAMPLMLELDFILKIWLKTPPAYTSEFCWFILAVLLGERMVGGHIAAINARGRIAAFQITSGVALLSTVPLAWLLIHFGYPPPCVGIAFLVTQCVWSLSCVLWARRLVEMPIRPWLLKFVMPCVITVFVSWTISLFIRSCLPPCFGRFVLVSMSSVVLLMAGGWFIVLDRRERDFFTANFDRLKRRVLKSRSE